MTDFMREYGARMVANGWPIVEILPQQKRCVRRGWQNAPLRAEEVKEYYGYGIGILCGREGSRIMGLDFDLPDEELSNAVKERLQCLPDFPAFSFIERDGAPNKFLLIARAERAGKRKSTSKVFEKDGRRAELEVLGEGQQFVCYGIHPGTKSPYEITGMGGAYGLIPPAPADTTPDEMPVVSDETVEALKAIVEEEALRLGWTLSGEGSSSLSEKPESSDLTLSDLRCPDITLEKARRILGEIRPNLGAGTHDAWVHYGMALKHQFGEEARALWHDISREYGPEAYDAEACERAWESFRDRANGITFRWVLKEWSKVRDPECGAANELGLALRTKRDYGDYIAYLPESSRWAGFDLTERRWKTLGGDAVVWDFVLSGTIRKTLGQEIEEERDEDRRKTLVNFYLKVCNSVSGKVSAVLQQLKGTPKLHKRVCEFDADHDLFACSNGVIHLPTRRLMKETPEMLCMRHSPVRYDPSARCPTWERAVLQVFGSVDKVKFFQQAAGAALSGKFHDPYLLLVRGLGKNGKTMAVNTLASVFGEYAVPILENTLMGVSRSEGGAARSDLAKLNGARLVYCSETTEGQRLKEADVKRMTGEDKIVARAPYGAYDMEFDPTWRLVMVTNHVPSVKGVDDGIWRRFADLECPHQFGIDEGYPEDPYLADKLKAELPGILNWLLDGLDAYRRKTIFSLPEEVRIAVEEYRSEQDEVGSWLAARLTPSTESKELLKADVLYKDFVDYCRDSGDQTNLTKNQFIRRVGNLARRKKLAAGAFWRRSYNVWRLSGYSFRFDEDATGLDEV